MKKLRILVLMHEDLIPPSSLKGVENVEVQPWKTEYDVSTALEDLGHEVRGVGVQTDVGIIREALEEFRPHITFNLLQEFHGVSLYDHSVVSYLELLKQRYTGCNPRGLMLTQDKALSKKILAYHRIPVPEFQVYPMGRKVRRPKRLEYPLIVKSLTEHASLGISQASVVRNDVALIERVGFIHDEIETDAIVERFIEGREIYVGILGNSRLTTLPPWELTLENAPGDLPLVATERVKWDPGYQEEMGVDSGPAKGLAHEQASRIQNLCKRAYRRLNMSGYARIDLRLTADNRAYILEANANPDLSFGEDFSASAEAAGLGYENLLERILRLGLRYRPHWSKVD